MPILYPNSDQPPHSEWAKYSETRLRTDALYEAINETEADQDGDSGFIYTLNELEKDKDYQSYTCGMEDYDFDETTAVASAWVKGPNTPTLALAEVEELDAKSVGLLCHTDLKFEVIQNGLAVAGRSFTLGNTYEKISVEATLTARVPVFLRFTPRKIGNGARYCRITQAQIVFS